MVTVISSQTGGEARFQRQSRERTSFEPLPPLPTWLPLWLSRLLVWLEVL